MIIKTNGKICQDFYVTGPSIAPVYLFDGEAPILFDAGFSALDYFYKKHIEDILGDRKPAYLFLTHSHFDHIGTASRMKKRWPGLKIAGTEKCQKTLTKKNALSMIQSLSRESTKNFKKAGLSPICDEPFEPFDIDLYIEHEKKINISPGLSVLPIKTPGHTWDFFSYWIPGKKNTDRF